MKVLLSALVAAGIVVLPTAPAAESLIQTAPDATPREIYGASRLSDALASAGVRLPAGSRILAGTRSAAIFSDIPNLPVVPDGAEAFALKRAGNNWLIVGSDPSGVLYGSLEMARRIAAE